VAAHADDLRYFYAASLGRCETLSVTDSGSVKPAAALEPGRYLVHVTTLSGTVYVSQGPYGSVEASAGDPSFPFTTDGIKAVEVVVRPGNRNDGSISGSDGIAAIAGASGSGLLHITKISRDRK
jgi:hypothetical protein